MKVCPICKARCFEDMEICYGCMHHFQNTESTSYFEEAVGEAPKTSFGAGWQAFAGEPSGIVIPLMDQGMEADQIIDDDSDLTSGPESNPGIEILEESAISEQISTPTFARQEEPVQVQIPVKPDPQQSLPLQISLQESNREGDAGFAVRYELTISLQPIS